MSSPHSQKHLEIMLIDSDIKVEGGYEETNDELGIWISNKNRQLRTRAYDHFEWKVWMVRLNTVIKRSAWGPYSKFRYDSFAPERVGNNVKFFVDGEEYFEQLYKSLCGAKNQVCITDWWLSPEYYLKRPVNFDNDDMEKYRLDNILGELAKAGVKIFIIVYKEVEFAGLYHDSTHTKLALQGKHPNIKVLRHPRTFV